jgi:hypothetical protein
MEGGREKGPETGVGAKKPSGIILVRLAPPPQGRGGNWVRPGDPERCRAVTLEGGAKKEERKGQG